MRGSLPRIWSCLLSMILATPSAMFAVCRYHNLVILRRREFPCRYLYILLSMNVGILTSHICVQISEVVNSMKDLIDFSRDNSVGPIGTLLFVSANFD